MPNLNYLADVVETSDFQYTGQLSFVKRTVVFSRFVNMATIPELTKAITFDGSGMGAYTDVEFGQTVIVYHQNTSTVKGSLRVAFGAASSTVLQVNEFAQGELKLADNDRFEVCNDLGIHHMLVSNTADFLKDSREIYVDQLDEMSPVSNSGGPIIGFVDEDTGLLTASAYGDTAVSVANPGDAVLEHDWSFGSGVTPETSTDENPAGVTIPAGFRFGWHDTTDPNGKTTRQKFPIWAHEREGVHAPMPVQMKEITSSIDNGPRGSFIVPITDVERLAELYHGALCFYWEEEVRNNVVGSYGAGVEGRSHIKLGGYLDAESIKIDRENDIITFELLGTLPILEKTPALPQIVIGTGLLTEDENDDWQHMLNPTIWRFLWYLSRYGATFNLLFDFLYLDASADLLFKTLSTQGTTIAEQLRDMASAINVQVLNDLTGRLLFRRSPNYLPVLQRMLRTIIYDLSVGCIVTVEWRQEHRRQGRLAVCEGITIIDQPVFSRAPGNAPGPGTRSETLSKQIVLNQDDADFRAGEKFAEIDGTYYDESTKSIRVVPMDVEVRIIAAMDFFDPGLGDYVRLILPASTNRRGVSFGENDRFLVRSKTVTYDVEQGAKEITLILDHETHGLPGKAQPEEIKPEIPGVDFEDPNFDDGLIEVAPPPLVPPLVTVGIGIGRFLAFGTAGPYAARVTSPDGFLTPANYVYTDISAGLTGKCVLAHVNPHPPGHFYVITTEGLFRGFPLATPFVGWQMVADNLTIWGDASAVSSNIRMSINRPGWIMLRSGNMTAACADINANPNSWVRLGIDGGTWSTGVFGGGIFPNLRNSGSTGHIYASEGGYPSSGRVWRNTTWGLSGTWGAVPYATMAGTIGTDVVAPYKRLSGAPNLPNDSVSLVYGGGVSGTGQSSLVYLDNGSAVDISDPELYRAIRVGGNSQRALVVGDDDPRRVYTGAYFQYGATSFGLGVAFADDADAFVVNNAGIGYGAGNAANSYPVYGITLNPANANYAMLYLAGVGLQDSGGEWDTNSGGLVATPNKGVDWVNLMTPELEAILGSVRCAYAQAA